MVNAVAPTEHLCGLCLDPMEGKQVVLHKGITPPSHAIHRECFLGWRQKSPNQRAVCLLRCGGAPEYDHRIVSFDRLLADAEGVHQCAICQINLAQPNPLLGPVLTHPGVGGYAHNIHKQCLKNQYVQSGNLNCPRNCEHLSSVRSIFTPEELRYLEKKEKWIAVAATVVLAAATSAGWCFSVKLISQVLLGTYMRSFIEFLGQSLPGADLGFGLGIAFISMGGIFLAGLALLELAEKVGRCFRRFPVDGSLVIMRAMGVSILATLRIITLSPTLCTFKIVTIFFTSITAIFAGIFLLIEG